MDTLSSVFGYGLDYVKAYKFPGLSTLIPFWPFSKGESFEDEIPDPAEEDADADADAEEDAVKDTKKKEAFEEDAGEEGTAASFEKALTKDVDPVVKSVINIVLYILYYVSIFILASIVANDLIYTHWGVRLFSFWFVIYLCFRTSTFVYPISIYYVINGLYNIYMNYRDKPLDPVARKAWHPRPILPRRYAFLPIITSRNSGILDLLNPFSYFPLGDDPKDPKYANYIYDAANYKENLNIVIPDFVKYKDEFLGTLLKKFNVYFAELNKPFIKYTGPDAINQPSPNELKGTAMTAMTGIKEQVKGAIVTATGLEESAKYIAQTLKPT